MTYLFQQCTSLKKINVKNFDTSNVQRMFGMFSHLESVTELDLSSFDTRNVENFGSMF